MSSFVVNPSSSVKRDRKLSFARESVPLSRCDFDVFVRDYAGRLQAVARRLLRSEEDAADALQDALLSAFAARQSYCGNSTVYTWLYRIVVNTCLMKIRSRRNTALVPLHTLLPSLEGEGGQTERSVLSTRCPDHLEAEENRAAVRACIDRLPTDFRMAVVLRDMEQREMQEAAALLNLSYVAFKTRLHRARHALRQMLEPVGSDPRWGQQKTHSSSI